MISRSRLIALLGSLALLLGLVAGCSSAPTPPDGAQSTAESLATVLEDGSLATSAPAGLFVDGAYASEDYAQITSDIASIHPEVSVGEITYDSTATFAFVPLNMTYDFPGIDWKYTSQALLHHTGESWQVVWRPQTLHPQLDTTTKFQHSRLEPKRAPIVGPDGRAIVENMPVYRVGIDKMHLDPDMHESSARELARVLGLNADDYAARVEASGPQAFVEAIVLRQGEVPAEIGDVQGVIALEDSLPLSHSKTFAAGLLGTSGPATAEIIEKSDGTISAGDIVGYTGLQGIHDARLRGVQGDVITLVPRSDKERSALTIPPPLPSMPAMPTPEAAPDDQATPEGIETLDLFSSAPQDGEPLRITLDVDLQTKAEAMIADYRDSVFSIVMLDRSTGAIRVLANSPYAGAQDFTATGAYPPGSTMKVSTSLALLRRGFTPDSMVDCSPQTTVDGRTFNNYTGFPSAFNGQITLRTALEKSCNTAFMNEAIKMRSDELAHAAASLGVGVDYETGFNAFYGSVPPTEDRVMRAADSIGQGEVVASPLAMAGEAASVAAGRTIVPWLVEGMEPKPTAEPLTQAEAEQLQSMMAAVLGPGGTAADLAGVLEGAKTGTAEYTNDDPPKTHGWLVGYNSTYAICVFEYDHTSVSRMHQVVREMLS